MARLMTYFISLCGEGKQLLGYYYTTELFSFIYQLNCDYCKAKLDEVNLSRGCCTLMHW